MSTASSPATRNTIGSKEVLYFIEQNRYTESLPADALVSDTER